jgi:glycosyltransferase involved in cell wall biosynthesis
VRILIDYRAALRQRTGVGEYVHELAVALARSAPPGESLTLFSSSWKDRFAASDGTHGVRVIDRRVPVRALNFGWHRLGWPSIEWLTGERFDVVQTAHPLPIPSRTAARIVTVHDLDFLDHPERTRAEIRRDYPALAPAAVRGADHVLVNSSHTGGEVTRRLGVPPERITVCTPGAPGWPRRTSEPTAGYLLFFGTLEPRKNVGLLLDAYERLVSRGTPLPMLVLAGSTPPEAEPLLGRVGRAPLAGRVDVRGYIAPEDRQALYAGALALVMPSHTEGFGIPALEAMTVGVPVIAADRGALPEVVGRAGVLFDPGDAAALTRAIETLVESRAERDRMREAGWQQAEHFSWTRSAERARAAWALAVEHRRRRG